MGLGIYRCINKLYINFIVLKFQIRKIIFGFENANKMFLTMDKRAAIPLLKKFGASIGEYCDIETPLIFHNCTNYKNLKIGNSCHIGKYCFFDLKDNIEIGDNVTISMQTTIITHLDLRSSKLSKIYPSQSNSVTINSHTYIGANSLILSGVTLKEGSFIAAGSVVTKDVDSFTMVGGVPAREINRLI